MIYYLSVLVWVYFLSPLIHKTGSWFFLVFSAPVIMFATFRGHSGKDTELYIIRYNQDIFSLDSLASFDSEPFFGIISSLAKVLDFSYSGLFFLHSFFICVLYYLICKKWHQAKYFILTIGPVILIDGITNGMRITIAYHLLILFCLYKKKVLAYVLSPLGHVSIVLSVFFNEVFERISKGLSLKQVLLLFVAISIVFFATINIEMVLSFSPRLLNKYYQYQSLSVVSPLSGLSDIFVVFFMLAFSALFNSKNYLDLIFKIVIALAVATLLYASVQLSIAFIRILKLFMISLLISPLIIQNRRTPDYIFIIIGFIYTSNFMRQVLNDPGILPYGVQ